MKLNSLRSRIILIVGLVVFIFGALATLFVYEYSHRRLLEQARSNQAQITKFQAYEISQYFQNLRGIITQLSQNPEINIELAKSNHNNEKLSQLFNSFVLPEQFLSIYLMDANGKAIVSTDKRFLNQNYSFRPYFKQALAGQPAFDIAFGVSTNELGFYLSQPVYNKSQEIFGVLVGKLKPSMPNLSINVSDLKTKNTKVIVTDELGIIIYSTNKNLLFSTLKPLTRNGLILAKQRYAREDFPASFFHNSKVELTKKGKVQSEQVFDPDDQRNKLISFTRIKDTPFYLLIEENAAAYLTDAFNVAFIISAFVLFAALGSVLVMNYLIKWLLDPLHVLHGAVINLAKGDFTQRVHLQTGDELEDLGKSFNQMVESVIRSRREVDMKVEQQTKEIVKKSHELEKQQKATLNVLEDVEKERALTAKQAQDLKKYLLAIENASDHIVITDSEGIILYANRAVEEITGFSVNEIVNKKVGIKQLWGGQMDTEFYKKLWQTVKEKKQVFTGEINNRRKNGEPYVALASISPVVDNGKVTFFVGIERDITRAKEVDRMKTEFISLASHQLRTPLSAMKWFLEMLLKGDAGKLSKEQTEMVDNINQSNERMIDLVNSLLNISRIESGRIIIDPQKTEITKLIKGLLTELQNKIEAKKQQFSLKIEPNLPLINLDPKLIRNALQNLLTNAIKYTPSKGKISLTVKKQQNNFIIKIADTGYGIPKKEQEKVFSKLYRGTNVVKFETDGNGLGLYLVKGIVDASGGKIWFESHEGKGTMFWISLPIRGVPFKKGEVTIDA